MPVHIKVGRGDVAERVVFAGDPARVRQIASMLDNVRLVNENRGFITYTGEYKGIPITVATHGLGTPSALVVLEELISVGGKYFVRLGTCGSLVKGVKIGDVVIPTGASYYPGGAHYQYYGEFVCGPATPDFTLLKSLVEIAEERKINYLTGPVISSDAFYAEDPKFVEKWSSRGVVAVEMECAGIFNVGLMRRVRTAALLIVSNSLVEELGHASAKELEQYVFKAAEIVLESLIRVKQ